LFEVDNIHLYLYCFYRFIYIVFLWLYLLYFYGYKYCFSHINVINFEYRRIIMNYRSRVIDRELCDRLSSTGAVILEGPKACGKTTTARQFAASEVLLDIDKNAREAAKIEPELILSEKTPQLIDEWQLEPNIWNHIRRTIDKRSKPGQFILTGSAVPSDDITRHTGAGRLTRIKMRPMTLYETGHSTGKISLKDMFDGIPPSCKDPGLSIKDLAERIAVGGWPFLLDLGTTRALQGVRSYLDEIKRVDISRIGNNKRDPDKVGWFLQSLARNVSTAAAVPTLVSDMKGNNETVHDDTVREYLNALSRLMITEEQPAWAPHLRSKSRLRKSSKHHFVDPSLAVAALHGTPERLLKDLEFLGLLFESLVIRDLRVFAQAVDAKVFHYLDNTGLEVDAVVEAADGRWGAFEIKLSSDRVEEGKDSLLKFIEKVDMKNCGKPDILGVIVGKGYGHLREDGVAVIPIGALAP
jgi:uncharacterized protein